MLTYPDINPVAIAVGPFEVHWYGLMYLFAFAAGWWLGHIRTRRIGTEWRSAEISDLVFYFALGAVLGGRIGYTLMYNFSGFVDDPTVILKIWQGGMSYHGGMIGVFVAMWMYGRHTGRTFFQVTDFLAPLVPLGLGAGRMGNFINGELWGRPTDAAMGHGVSVCRQPATSPVHALRVHPRRTRILRHTLDILPQAATDHGGFRPVPDLLWRVPLCG